MKSNTVKQKRRMSLRVGSIAGLLLASGCAQVPVAQQRLVAKPEMTFQASAGSHPGSNLIGQIEPGSASSGGAQAAGCTSCR